MKAFSGCSVFGASLLIISLVFGCSELGDNTHDYYLLRIDGKVITENDFEDALEIVKTGYPYEALQNEETLKHIKTRLLKQMTEELILAKRAEELGIEVTDAELEEAVANIKSDYPEGAFKETLFENAVSMNVWKKRFRMRLLMEKVIERELINKVNVSTDEAKQYYQQHYKKSKKENEMPDAGIMKRLRREKAQEAYAGWIKRIQNQYEVELNNEKWKEILKQ
ncbi:MAG: SurA N-terminal domain-containing protein [Thermodesulfobacteriota bacterium]|nr:SurA N-terminal domain-containing protein [Thermodesulfobacteriota bacterium]